RNSCSSGILWSDDSALTASGVDVVRFLETGIVPSSFRWKNVTRTFYACIILSNLPLEKPLPVHNYRDGVRATARVPAPHHPNPRPYHDYDGVGRVHCKGVGGVGSGGDPCGRPGPHTAWQVQVSERIARGCPRAYLSACF